MQDMCKFNGPRGLHSPLNGVSVGWIGFSLVRLAWVATWVGTARLLSMSVYVTDATWNSCTVSLLSAGADDKQSNLKSESSTGSRWRCSSPTELLEVR